MVVLLQVGFIGLGQIGLKMMMNLTRAGHKVVAYDSNEYARERASQMLGEQCEVLDTPGEVASARGKHETPLQQLLPAPHDEKHIHGVSHLYMSEVRLSCLTFSMFH